MLLTLLIWTWQVFVSTEANPGKQFVVTLPQNDGGNNDGQVVLTPVSEWAQDIEVTLATSEPEEFYRTVTLTDGKPGVVQIPSWMKLPTGSVKISNRGVLVTATDFITVFISDNGLSYLALPTSQLGAEHFALAYTVTARSRSPECFLVITAVTHSTALTVTLPTVTVSSYNRLEYEDQLYGSNDVIVVNLNELDTVQFQAKFDLTGTHVKANMPVAVWAGLNRARMDTTTPNHVIEMMPPVNLYGRQFVLAPAPIPASSQKFRILVRNSLTTVCIYQPNRIVVYQRSAPGEYIEIACPNHQTYMFVYALQDVMVARYVSSTTGDSSMVVLTPNDKTYTSRYRFGPSIFGNHEGEPAYVTLIINKTQELYMTLNNESITTLSSVLQVSWYNVSGPEGLIAGVVQIDAALFEATVYGFRDSSCTPFSGYIDLPWPGQFDALPITHGISPDQAAFNASGLSSAVSLSHCCPLVNEQDKSRSNPYTQLEVRKAMETKCCILNGLIVPCSVKRVEQFCQMNNMGKAMSAREVRTSPSASPSICFRACADDLDCVGINYGEGPNVTSAERCMMLMGATKGYSGDVYPGYRAMDCSTDLWFNMG